MQNSNDPESNLLKGIHGLLNIVESTEANGLKQFVIALGVHSSIQQFTLSDLPMLDDYDFSLNRDFNSGKLAELFKILLFHPLNKSTLIFPRYQLVV